MNAIAPITRRSIAFTMYGMTIRLSTDTEGIDRPTLAMLAIAIAMLADTEGIDRLALAMSAIAVPM
jgi:hypothetical protein